MPERWDLIDTPNPSLFGFVVRVPQDKISLEPQLCPQEGDLFKTLGLKNNVSMGWIPDNALATDGRFGLYVYVQKSSDAKNGNINFIYGPPRTEEQKNTPYRETTVKRNHPWPPMLLGLVLIPDYTFLRTGKGYDPDTNEISEVVAPNYYVREVYVPGVNEGTKMVKREYFSPTKYDIPQTPVPVPTSVSYDINGVRGSFPECLHPKIEIISTRSGIAQVVAGVVSSVGGALEGQIFPATNFEEWAPYIATDTQELTEAGWYRVQMIAIPPEMPDTIVQ